MQADRQTNRHTLHSLYTLFAILPGAVMGIFIWVGQSKAKQILGRPTGVVYVGQNFVWVSQAQVSVGHGLPGLIAKTASEYFSHFMEAN